MDNFFVQPVINNLLTFKLFTYRIVFVIEFFYISICHTSVRDIMYTFSSKNPNLLAFQ